MSDPRGRLAAITLTATVFAAVVPTLSWLEFSNGAEGLNVATAMEIRRSGNWLTPTLGGEPRIAKPPLTAWLTAAAIRDDTFTAISATDPTVRRRAFERLALQVRLPALLAGCLTLYAIFELGSMLIGRRGGLLALVVAASTLLWLRFARYTTTDIQLAMWVTIANLGFATALLNQRRWAGFLTSGLALGFAFMSKGPVCLVQSVVPAMVFLLWRCRVLRETADKTTLAARVAAIATGAILMLAIAIPWFVIVALRQPTAVSTWFVEVTREGATEQEPDRWYSYFSLVLYMAPWMAFFVAGIALALQRLRSGQARGLIYAAIMLLVPVVLMALFRDRQIRYLLPLLAPASILTAAAALEWWNRSPFDRFQRILGALHWVTLAGIAVGFPLAAGGLAPEIRRVDGQPWLSRELALGSAILGAAVILIAIVVQRRWRGALPGATLLLMLPMQALFVVGYRESDRGRADMRPLADLISSEFATAEIFSARRPRPDIRIYTNRTIRLVDDPQSIQPAARPQILLLFQRKGAAMPAAPPGWKLIGRASRNQDWWYAYLLSATAGSTTLPVR